MAEETLDVRIGEKINVMVDTIGAQSIQMVDCKVLFDRVAFSADTADAKASDFIAANADFMADFDDTGLKVLIACKSKLIVGAEDLFGLQLTVSDKALEGEEYILKFSQSSFALAKPEKAGQPGKEISTTWQPARLNVVATNQQIIRIRVSK